MYLVRRYQRQHDSDGSQLTVAASDPTYVVTLVEIDKPEKIISAAMCIYPLKQWASRRDIKIDEETWENANKIEPWII